MFRKVILFILIFVFCCFSQKPVKYDSTLFGKWCGVLESNSNNWLRFDSNGMCFSNRSNTIEMGNWSNIGDDSLYFCFSTNLIKSVPVLQEFSGSYGIIEDTLMLYVKVNLSSKDFEFIIDDKYRYIPMVKCK